MNKKATLVKVVDTLTEKPITITVAITNVKPVEKISFFDKYIRRKKPVQPETERTFIMRPIVLCNMYRVACTIVDLPDNIEGEFPSMMNMVYNHYDELVYIVAVGLQNNKHEPAPELIAFIKEEFASKDLHIVYQAIIEQMNVVDFMHSIILIKGANVLTVKEQSATSAIIPD